MAVDGGPVTNAGAPARASLNRVRQLASQCRACALWRDATQTVFGEGDPHARVMLVGEQPGDREDRSGRPFVGPAGAMLDRALEAAGIDRTSVYVTNSVKHFKFEERGKRRIHKKPNLEEVRACKPWLDDEIARVGPALVVLMGATAVQSVLGKSAKVTADRGRLIDSGGNLFVITAHPSSILRMPDGDSRREALDALVEDLRVAQQALAHQRKRA